MVGTAGPEDLVRGQCLHPREEFSILELGKLERHMVGESARLVLVIFECNTVYDAPEPAQRWKGFAHVCWRRILRCVRARAQCLAGGVRRAFAGYRIGGRVIGILETWLLVKEGGQANESQCRIIQKGSATLTLPN